MNFDEAVAALTCGGVLVLSTDTLPGLHCRADRQDSVLRVAGMKGRDDGKPLLVMAGSLEQGRRVCAPWTDHQESFCRACWPGPFSLILPAAGTLAPRVTCGEGTVAVRVPREPLLRDLILAVGFPLVSTSVNRQGEPPARTLAQARKIFASQVAGCWSGDGQGAPSTRPSALVDLTGNEARVLRDGPEPLPEPR